MRRRASFPCRGASGWALALAASMATTAAAQAPGRLSGTAYDSVAARPLAGAVIQVVRLDNPSRSLSTTSDAQGRFSVDSVPAGTWLVGLLHPALDALALEPPTTAVVVREGEAARVMLAVPSRATIARLVCPDTGSGGHRGVWIGSVQSARSRSVVPGAQVAVEWSELRADRTSFSQRRLGTVAAANAAGLFAICGIPSSETIYARAAAASDSSGMVSFYSPPDGFVQQALYVGPSRMDTIPASDRSAEGTESLGGDGALRGRVQRDNGRAVGGARVVFWGHGGESLANSEGRFALDGLPLGSHTLEVRALGYVPERRVVHVLSGEAGVEQFVLESRQSYLDTVKVIGQRVAVSGRYQEFLDRKRRGFGHFMDGDDIERRNAFFVSDLVRMMPGVRVMPAGVGGSRVLMRGTGFATYCNPALFLDGMRIQPGVARESVGHPGAGGLHEGVGHAGAVPDARWVWLHRGVDRLAANDPARSREASQALTPSPSP